MMDSSRVLSLIIICLIQLTNCALAEVDTSSPNIGGFKLRHVDLEAEARKRAEEPITELWVGATLLKESLIVDSNYVKCPAYAHLFRLIKQQNKEIKFGGGLQQDNKIRQLIKQNVIKSLAIVVTYDRLFYHKLFENSLTNSAELFLEAALGLEDYKEPKAHEAWLDVLMCLEEYMESLDKVVGKFLTEPKRVQALESMSRFMSIPVDNEKAPMGLVPNLIRHFENVDDITVDPNVFNDAYKTVLSFEDDFTSQQRVKFNLESDQKQQEEASKIKVDIGEQQKPVVIMSGVEQQHQGLEKDGTVEDIVPLSEQEMKNIHLSDDIEIVVPLERISTDDTQTISKQEISLDQLAILKFIKMRLESKQRTPRLSMRLLFDFRVHFEDLMKAELNLNSELGKASKEFRDDPRNLELYKSTLKVIDDYLKIMDVLAEIQALSLDTKLDSLEEFGKPLDKLNDLLGKFDSSYDLNDIRRLQAIWRLKYKEYSTIQNLLDSDGSW